jgi:hypothetical protein
MKGQETTKMKTKLIATLMLAGSSLFAGPRIAFGVNVAVPVAPVAVVAPVAIAPVAVYGTPYYAAPVYPWVGYGVGYGYAPRVFGAGLWRGPAFGGRVFAGRGFARGFRR